MFLHFNLTMYSLRTKLPIAINSGGDRGSQLTADNQLLLFL